MHSCPAALPPKPVSGQQCPSEDKPAACAQQKTWYWAPAPHGDAQSQPDAFLRHIPGRQFRNSFGCAMDTAMPLRKKDPVLPPVCRSAASACPSCRALPCQQDCRCACESGRSLSADNSLLLKNHLSPCTVCPSPDCSGNPSDPVSTLQDSSLPDHKYDACTVPDGRREGRVPPPISHPSDVAGCFGRSELSCYRALAVYMQPGFHRQMSAPPYGHHGCPHLPASALSKRRAYPGRGSQFH